MFRGFSLRSPGAFDRAAGFQPALDSLNSGSAYPRLAGFKIMVIAPSFCAPPRNRHGAFRVVPLRCVPYGAYHVSSVFENVTPSTPFVMEVDGMLCLRR
jgi:hypothetical protein